MVLHKLILCSSFLFSYVHALAGCVLGSGPDLWEVSAWLLQRRLGKYWDSIHEWILLTNELLQIRIVLAEWDDLLSDSHSDSKNEQISQSFFYLMMLFLQTHWFIQHLSACQPSNSHESDRVLYKADWLIAENMLMLHAVVGGASDVYALAFSNTLVKCADVEMLFRVNRVQGLLLSFASQTNPAQLINQTLLLWSVGLNRSAQFTPP